MLFELIGPAGCGKTTVARAVDRALCEGGTAHVGFEELEAERRSSEQRLKRGSALGKLCMLLPLLLRHPSVVASLYLLALLHGPPLKLRIRHANRALAHLLLLRRLDRGDRILLVHEGFMQMLWSLTVESRALRGVALIRHLLRVYQRMLAPHGILFCIDEQRVTERVFQRTVGNRFSAKSSEQRRREFPRWLEYQRRLVELAPPGLIATKVDATQPLEALAGDVARTILASVAPLPAPVAP
jgi:hypothetical protein